MKERIISLLLAAIMVVSLIPIQVFAAGNDEPQSYNPTAWVEGYADGSTSNFRASQMLVVRTSGFAPEANLKYHYYSQSSDRAFAVFSFDLIFGWPLLKLPTPPPSGGGLFGGLTKFCTALANVAEGLVYMDDAESGSPFFSVAGHPSTGMKVKVTVTDTNEASPTFNRSVTLYVGGFTSSNLTKDICVPHAMFEGDNSHVLYLLATSGVGHIYPECEECATINSLALSNVDEGTISWSGDTYAETSITAVKAGVAKMDLSLTKASTCTFHPGTTGAGTSYIKVFKKPTVTPILDGFDLTNTEAGVTYTVGGQSKTCTAANETLEFRGLAPSCEYNIECSYKLPDNSVAKASVTKTTLAPYQIKFVYTELDNLSAAPKMQKALRNNTEKATKPEGPYAPGYVLTGWYADLDYETPFDFDQPITDDTFIYGKWEKMKYTVKLNLTLDDAAYSGRKVELWQDGQVKYTLESKGNGLYELDDAVATGKYDVYVDGKSCYHKITVIGVRTELDMADRDNLIAGETVEDAVAMISLKTTCTVDGVPGEVVEIFYRDEYGQKFVAAYQTAKNGYTDPVSTTDPRKFDIFADNVDSGGDISKASPNTTLEFYNMTLNAKISDSTWSCDDVVLRDANGYYIGTMQPQPYANGVKPYTYLMQKDAGTTPKEYYVYVNGANTNIMLMATEHGHIKEANIYAPTFTLKKDGAAWEDAALTLTNGDYSYTLHSNANGVCRPGLVYTPGAEKAYTVSVIGAIDNSDSPVTSSDNTVTLDYYTVKYYTYKNTGTEEAPNYTKVDTPYSEQIVRAGEQAAQVAAPYVEGLSFDCFSTSEWSPSEASVTPYNFGMGVTEALSLYAHFEKPTVTFNGFVRTIESGTAAYDGEYFTLANLTISGFDEGAAIKSIVINTNNAAVTADDPTGGTADKTIPNNPVITFTSKATMSEAQTYLRGLVFRPIDSTLPSAVSITVSDGVASISEEAVITPSEVTDATWTKLSTVTTGSTTGYPLNSGNYYVDKNVSFTNSTAGGSGLTINGTVNLYIPAGIKVTATGADGSGQTGGGAGVELSSGNTLNLYGEGTLEATGGNGASGTKGGNGGNATSNLHFSCGIGGGGGGGGGAGIGTKGGTGGSSPSEQKKDSQLTNANGNPGTPGNNGTEGVNSGTLCVSGSVTISATGGGKGNEITGKATVGNNIEINGGHHVGGSGGGGNGAPGREGNDIGPGGSGGGSGGNGGMGGCLAKGMLPGAPAVNGYPTGGRGGDGDGVGETGVSGTFNINTIITGGKGGDGGTTPENKDATTAGTSPDLPAYTVKFDGGSGQTTTVNYTWTRDTNQIVVPDYTPASGQFFLGWQVSTYGKNVNGSGALTTAETTLYQPGAIIKLAELTYGNIVLKPVTMSIAGKTATEKLDGITLPETPQQQYTYTVTTKLNSTVADIGSITLKNGTKEYTIGGKDGVYTLITTDDATFNVYLDGEDTGVVVAAGGTAEVNVLSYTVTTNLDGVASTTPGDVTLKSSSTILASTAVMDGGQPTGTYQLRKLPTGGITADTEFAIYVDGKNTGVTMNAGDTETVDYYTATVSISGDAPIESVVLKNAAAGDVTLTKKTGGVYTGIRQKDETNAYKVYVDGKDTGKTLKFDGQNGTVTGKTLALTLRVNGAASDQAGYVPTYGGAPMSKTAAGSYYAVEFGTVGKVTVNGVEKGFTDNACTYDYYTVTYDANCTGFTGAVPTDSIYYLTGSKPEVLAAGTLAREGYQLQGWTLGSDKTVYKEGDKLPAVSAAVTLKAVWKAAADYPITVIMDGEVIPADPMDLDKLLEERGYPGTGDGNPGMTIIVRGYKDQPDTPVELPKNLHLGPKDTMMIEPGVKAKAPGMFTNEGELEIKPAKAPAGEAELSVEKFVNKGTVKNDGEMTVEKGSNEVGGTFVNGGKFTVEGTTPSGVFENKGSFENKENAEVTIKPDGGMKNAEGGELDNKGELTVNGKFTNEGTVNNTGEITSDNLGSAEFENNGTINNIGGSIDTPIDNEDGAVIGGELGENGKVTGGTAVGMDPGSDPNAISGAMNAPGGTVNDPAPGGNLPANSPIPTQAQLDAIFGKGNTVLANDDGTPMTDDNGGYIVVLLKGIQLKNPVVVPEGVKATIELAGNKLTGPDGKPAIVVAGGTVIVEDVIGGGAVNGGKGTSDGGSGGPGIQVTSGSLEVAEITAVNGGPGVGSGSGGAGVDVDLDDGKTCGVEIKGNVTGGAGGASSDGTAGSGGNGINVDLPQGSDAKVDVTGEVSGGEGGATIEGTSGSGGGAVTIASAPENSVTFDETKAKGGSAGDVVDEEKGKKGTDSEPLNTDIPQGGTLPVGGVNYENPGPGKLKFDIFETHDQDGQVTKQDIVLTDGNIDMPKNGEVSADGARVKNATDNDTNVRVTINENGGADITVPAPEGSTDDPTKTVTVKGIGTEETGVAKGGVDVLPVGQNGEISLKPDKTGVEIVIPAAVDKDVQITDGSDSNAPDVTVKGGSTGKVTVKKTATGFETKVENGAGETSTVVTGGTEYTIPENTIAKLTATEGKTPATITQGTVELGKDKGPNAGGAGVVIPTAKPYTVTNASGADGGTVKVTKTATGANITVPAGSAFAITKADGKKETYTAEGTLTSVYVTDGSGNVKLGDKVVEGETEITPEPGVALKLDTGTVTLKDGQSVYANTPATGDKGKLIFNPTNTLDDNIVVDAGDGTVDTTITLTTGQTIGLGGVLKNSSITGASRYTAETDGTVLVLDKTSSVFDDGTTLLKSGAVKLDAEDEKIGIVGATAKYFVDVPTGKPTVTVTKGSTDGTCDITVPASGEVDITVGGNTYKFVNSYTGSVTVSVSADGMTVTVGGTAYTMTAGSDTTLTFKAYAGTGIGVTSPVTTLTAGAVMLDKNETIFETNGKTVIKNTNETAITIETALTAGKTDTLVPFAANGSIEIDGVLYENPGSTDLKLTVREVNGDEKIILKDGAAEMGNGGRLTVDGVTVENSSGAKLRIDDYASAEASGDDGSFIISAGSANVYGYKKASGDDDLTVSGGTNTGDLRFILDAKDELVQIEKTNTKNVEFSDGKNVFVTNDAANSSMVTVTKTATGFKASVDHNETQSATVKVGKDTYTVPKNVGEATVLTTTGAAATASILQGAVELDKAEIVNIPTTKSYTVTNATGGDNKVITVTAKTESDIVTGADILASSGATLTVTPVSGTPVSYTATGKLTSKYVTDSSGNVFLNGEIQEGSEGTENPGVQLVLTEGEVTLDPGETVYTDSDKVILNSSQTGVITPTIVTGTGHIGDTNIPLSNGQKVTIGDKLLNGVVQASKGEYEASVDGTVVSIDKSTDVYDEGTVKLTAGTIKLDADDEPIGITGAQKAFFIGVPEGKPTVTVAYNNGVCTITIPAKSGEVSGEVDIATGDNLYRYVNNSASPVTVSITAYGMLKTELNNSTAPTYLPTGEYEGYVQSVIDDTTQYIFEDDLDTLLSKAYLDALSDDDTNKDKASKGIQNTVVLNTELSTNPTTTGYVLTQNCIDIYTAQGNLALNGKHPGETAYTEVGSVTPALFTVDSRERSHQYVGDQSIANDVTSCMVVKISNEIDEDGHVELQAGEAKIKWSDADTTYYVTLADALYDASHNISDGTDENQYNKHDGKGAPQTIVMNINPYGDREGMTLEKGDTLVIRGENNVLAGDSYVGVNTENLEEAADVTLSMYTSENNVYVVSGTVKVTNNTDDTNGETNGFADAYVGEYDTSHEKIYYAKTSNAADVLYVTGGSTVDGRADDAAYVTTSKDAQSVEIRIGTDYVTYKSYKAGETFPIASVGKIDSDGEQVNVDGTKITEDYSLYSVLDETTSAKVTVESENTGIIAIHNSLNSNQMRIIINTVGDKVSVNPMGDKEGTTATEYTAAKAPTVLTVKANTGKNDTTVYPYVTTLTDGAVKLEKDEAIFENAGDVKIQNTTDAVITVETAKVNTAVGEKNGIIVTVPEGGNFNVFNKDGRKTGLNGITVKAETKFFVDKTGHITMLNGTVEVEGNADSFIDLGTNDEKVTGVDGALTVEAVRTNGTATDDMSAFENGVTTGYVTIPAGKQATFDNAKGNKQTYLNPTQKPDGTGNDASETVIAILPTAGAQRVVVFGDIELDNFESIYVTDVAYTKATADAVNTPRVENLTLVTNTGCTKIQVSYGNTDTLALHNPDPFNTVTIPEKGEAKFTISGQTHKVAVKPDGSDLENTMLEAAVITSGDEKEITVSFPKLDYLYRAVTVDGKPSTYTNKDAERATLLGIAQDGTVYAKKGNTDTDVTEGDILLDPKENVNVKLDSGYANVKNTATQYSKKISVGKEMVKDGKNVNPVTVPKGGDAIIEGVVLNTTGMSANTEFDIVKENGDILTTIPTGETLKIDGKEYKATAEAKIKIIPAEKHDGMTRNEIVLLSGTLEVTTGKAFTNILPIENKGPRAIAATNDTVMIPADNTVAINGIVIKPEADTTAILTSETITIPVPAGKSVAVDGIVYTNNSGSTENLVINATTGLPTDNTVFTDFTVDAANGLKAAATVTLPNGKTVERPMQTFTVPAGKSITVGERTYTAVDNTITAEANGKKADPIVTINSKVTITELKQLSKNPDNAEEKAENTYTATGTAKAVFTGMRDDVAVNEGELELTNSNVWHTVKFFGVSGIDPVTQIWNTGFNTVMVGIAEPQKARYTFAGWYYDSAFTEPVNVAEEPTDKLLSDVTLYAKWERSVSDDCRAEVSLKDSGEYGLKLGGVEIDEFTFTKSGSGWTIRNVDGRYLGFADKALTYTTSPFVWTYSNGRFQTSVTTTSGNNSGWGWGWNWGGSRTTTTTYYLAYVDGELTVSTATTGADATFVKWNVTAEHSFGETWTAEEGSERHYRVCSFCGEKKYADCEYNQEGHKCICGRIDPDLVTASFVTGEGASAAPKAQKVIKDEGVITRPETDPTKIGFIFDDWYRGDTDTKFTFGESISENVTITAKWTECEHTEGFDEETHICPKCGAKEVVCSGKKTVNLKSGNLIFTLGGHTFKDEYTFAKSGNGWTIQNADGKYLVFSNNALTYKDSSFVWTFSNNRFSATATTSSNSGFGWGWGGSRTTTTTYYLVYTGGKLTVSTNTNGANAAFAEKVESLTHTFGAWTTKNGEHSRTCTVCGKTETGVCSYSAWTTVNGVHTRTCTVCGNVDSGKCSYGAWTTEDGVHSHTCTICNDVESGNCTYGDWTPTDNNKHTRTCSVCGGIESGDCSYNNPDHKCSVCGRIDPNLEYVTATFETGEDASTAPAAQTVIKGEGLITKPENVPTKIGYIFNGWYVNETAFDFTVAPTADVTITAKWTQCDHPNGYDEKTHICSKCGLKDPNVVVHCSGDKATSLKAGELIFTLGNKNLGEHTFKKINNNTWTIKDNAKNKYLGFVNNAFAYVDAPFNWTFSNNRFQTTVTTTSGSNSGWGWGWNWCGNSRTTTTTYYLAYVGGKINVSTSTTGTNASFAIHVESDEHSGTWKTVGKTHTRKCEVCGETETENCTYGANHKCTVCGGYDPSAAKIEVSVSKSQRTSGNSGWGWGFGWGWGGYPATTYTATITAKATGATVSKVEYSTNNGKSWTSGNTVTSNSQIGAFLIRVTDNNGTVHSFKYDGSTITEN